MLRLPILFAFVATPVLADPCTAVPDRGSIPVSLRPGARFAGPVVYVGDGDSLCVAADPRRRQDPATWVEVRVADFYAPELATPKGREAKLALERIAMGRTATCKAQRRSYDRIVGVCRIEGRSIAAWMRSAGVAEGGRGR